MPGTLFLEALKRKERLTRGTPTIDKGVLSPEQLYASGVNGDPMWAATNNIARAIQRLRGSAEAAVANTKEGGADYERTRDRLQTEKGEGIERNKPKIPKAGLPR